MVFWRMEELEPGQIVWFAHSTRKARRRDPKLLRPVILTLVSMEEKDLDITDQGEPAFQRCLPKCSVQGRCGPEHGQDWSPL